MLKWSSQQALSKSQVNTKQKLDISELMKELTPRQQKRHNSDGSHVRKRRNEMASRTEAEVEKVSISRQNSKQYHIYRSYSRHSIFDDLADDSMLFGEGDADFERWKQRFANRVGSEEDDERVFSEERAFSVGSSDEEAIEKSEVFDDTISDTVFQKSFSTLDLLDDTTADETVFEEESKIESNIAKNVKISKDDDLDNWRDNIWKNSIFDDNKIEVEKLIDSIDANTLDELQQRKSLSVANVQNLKNRQMLDEKMTQNSKHRLHLALKWFTHRTHAKQTHEKTPKQEKTPKTNKTDKKNRFTTLFTGGKPKSNKQECPANKDSGLRHSSSCKKKKKPSITPTKKFSRSCQNLYKL